VSQGLADFSGFGLPIQSLRTIELSSSQLKQLSSLFEPGFDAPIALNAQDGQTCILKGLG